MATVAQSKWLDAPKSTNIVRVRMIDTTSVMLLNAKAFVEPITRGHELMGMTDVAFLIENERNGQKAVFDLGVRKDYWNLPPSVRQRLGKIALGLRVDKSVSEILAEKNISLDSINDVIWSHSHFDHTGDPALFPHSTALVYGPGVSQAKPGYPADQDAAHPETYFTNRENKEIDFSSSPDIGGFRAYDFYGDSSFYLLETPGHSRGHMCGLARVSCDSDGNGHFILLGGDVCHFCGDMRPNETFPLPEEYDHLLKEHPRFQNPPATLQITKRELDERRRTPWYCLSTDESSAYDYPSPQVAQKTIDTLAAHFDEADNVFTALAHDRGLLSRLPTLNKDPEHDLNQWFEKGLKMKDYWLWTQDLDPNQEKLVEGFWKDGKRYDSIDKLL